MRKFTNPAIAVSVIVAGMAFLSQPVTAQPLSAFNVTMGKTANYDLRDLLNQDDVIREYRNCDLTGAKVNISRVLSPENEDFVETILIDFPSHRCVFEDNAWLKSFLWDGICTEVSYYCATFGSRSYMTPGSYTLTVEVFTEPRVCDEWGECWVGDTDTRMSGSVSVSVLPANLARYSVAADRVFPFNDGFRDSVKGRVIAVDALGDPISFGTTLAMNVLIGGRKVSSTTVANDGQFNLAAPPKHLGKAIISGEMLHRHGNGYPYVFLNSPLSVTMAATKVTGVALSAPAVVYPVWDGFQDSATLSGNIASTVTKMPVSGAIEVKSGSKVLQTFKLSRAGAFVFHWNGKSNGQIRAGKYAIVLRAQGPEGSTATASRTISVSVKRIVTKTVQKTYGAYSATDSDQGNSYDPIDPYGTQGAKYYSSGGGDTMLVALSVPMPTTTRKWRLRINDYKTYDRFLIVPCTTSNCLDTYISSQLQVLPENSTSGWTDWTTAGIGGTLAYFAITSSDWGSLRVDSFTIEYVARVLQ